MKSKIVEIINCYVDSDWAGDKNDRKLTPGLVINVFRNAVYWRLRINYY